VATVRVSSAQFVEGRLPAVCAVSGVPAAEVFAVRAGDLRGAVPLHGEVVADLRRYRAATGAIAIAAAAALLVAVLLGSAAVLGASVALGAASAGSVLWVSSRAPVARRVGGAVELRHVHDAFVRAVSEPPGKCSGCTGATSCSIVEMDACEGHPAAAAAEPT